MGGGPASADVVRASCILTFPEETMVEPVPVDAWYLHAVGLTFLRRLARDRIGDEPKIALLMQKIDQETHQKRYISVSNDGILRKALKETFDEPERVLVLHIISLDKVIGQRSIHVTPEINPNVSPEPVEPLGMVFPALAVEAVQELPEATAISMSSSFRFGVDKLGRSSFISAIDKQQPHSDACLARSQEFGFVGMKTTSACSPTSSRPPVSRTPFSEEDSPFSFSAAGAKLIGDHADENEIPFARVVEHAGESNTGRMPSDYVMLDLQNGAGLGEPSEQPSLGASSFFISPTWHLQADDMGASTRLDLEDRRHTAGTGVTATTPLNGDWSSVGNSNSSMEESFVMLERDLTPK